MHLYTMFHTYELEEKHTHKYTHFGPKPPEYAQYVERMSFLFSYSHYLQLFYEFWTNL